MELDTDDTLDFHGFFTDVETINHRLAAVDLTECLNHLQGSGLAGAIRTEQTEDLARIHLKRDVVECSFLTLALDEMRYGDDRLLLSHNNLLRYIIAQFAGDAIYYVNRQLILNSFLRAIDKPSPWVVGTGCCVVFVVTNMLKPVVFALVENSYWLLVIGCYHFNLCS